MGFAGNPGLDPVTLEVVRSSLPACTNEMAQVLQRTSYNMMIYEVRDFSCAIVDRSGRLLAQNVGGVSHFVSDLGVVVTDALDRFGEAWFSDGDAVLMNHQRVCGQHLNNMVAYSPIFVGKDLFGFSMVRAHWVDVGGLSTGFGAGAGAATDPWMEGLQLDQVKIAEGGVTDEKVLKLISDNIRYPDSSMGDLRAQLAACQVGAQRCAELVERYGPATTYQAVERMLADSEARCREVVARFPDGEYCAEGFLDHDFVERDKPLKIAARVTISGSDMTIDLRGSSRQRLGGVNSRSKAGAYIAYRGITTPLEPLNEGSFAALHVIIDEGNFMMARFPAPMASWATAMPTVVDTVLKALVPAIPDRVPAAHFGTLGGPFVFFGADSSTGRRFVTQSIEGGGWGARPGEDGPSASVSACQGDVRNAPIESLELKHPVIVEERSLRTGSAGAGRYRGGLGVRTQVRSLADGTWGLSMPGRDACPPWGLFGGRPGEPGHFELQRGPDEPWQTVEAGRYRCEAGAAIRVLTGGGGGFGDPHGRPETEVVADIANGYVTRDEARDSYGVDVDPLTLEVTGRHPARSAPAHEEGRDD